jgi:hypothetical protein
MVKKEKKLTKKEQESLKTKEKIVMALLDEDREFYVNYSKWATGTATIMARSLKEAQEKLEDGDYDMEDNDSDIEFEKVEDSI